MALQVTLATTRRSAASGTFEQMTAAYLARCGRTLSAAERTFRTEIQLLDFVAREASATCFWIADLGGETLTTDQFATRIRTLRDNGTRHLILAVGPADGWSAQARASASLRLSLGAMTLPHELAALVLAEQIYRVSTIFQGHPYHLGH